MCPSIDRPQTRFCNDCAFGAPEAHRVGSQRRSRTSASRMVAVSVATGMKLERLATRSLAVLPMIGRQCHSVLSCPDLSVLSCAECPISESSGRGCREASPSASWEERVEDPGGLLMVHGDTDDGPGEVEHGVPATSSGRGSLHPGCNTGTGVQLVEAGQVSSPAHDVGLCCQFHLDRPVVHGDQAQRDSCGGQLVRKRCQGRASPHPGADRELASCSLGWRREDCHLSMQKCPRRTSPIRVRACNGDFLTTGKTRNDVLGIPASRL